MKNLVVVFFLFLTSIIYSQNSECILPLTQNGTVISVGMSDVNWVAPGPGSGADLIRFPNLTRLRVEESVSAIVSASDNLIPFTNAQTGDGWAVAKSFVNKIVEDAGDNTAIIQAVNGTIFRTTETYAAIKLLAEACVSGGDGNGGIVIDTSNVDNTAVAFINNDTLTGDSTLFSFSLADSILRIGPDSNFTVNQLGDIRSSEIKAFPINGLAPISTLAPSTGSSMRGNKPMDVQGDYAYMSPNGSAFLEIWNIADKTNPKLVSSTNLGMSTGDIALTIVGDYLIESNITNPRIFDVKDKANPVLLSTVTAHNGATFDLVLGNYIYGTGTNNQVQWIDLTDPANPRSGDFYVGNTLVQGEELASFEDKIVLASQDGGADSIQVISAADPENGVLLDVLGVPGGLKGSGLGLGGAYAYIADASSNILVYDLSDSIELVYTFGPSNYSGPGRGPIKVVGDYLLDLDRNAGVYIWDISTPTAPVQAGSIASINTNLRNMVFQGNYLYASGRNSLVVDIFDLGGLKQPSGYIGLLESSNVFIEDEVFVNGGGFIRNLLAYNAGINELRVDSINGSPYPHENSYGEFEIPLGGAIIALTAGDTTKLTSGLISAGELNNFSYSTGELTCDDASVKRYKVTSMGTFDYSVTDVTLIVFIYKNDVRQGPGTVVHHDGTNVKHSTLFSIQKILELTDTDDVEIRVRCDGTGTLTFNMNLMITEL